MKKTKFWDLGEEQKVKPTRNNLYAILNAVILCNGKILETYSTDIDAGEWVGNAITNSVYMRIELPVGKEEKFQKLTKFKLTEPPVFAGGNIPKVAI